jgi:hypothetical protein
MDQAGDAVVIGARGGVPELWIVQRSRHGLSCSLDRPSHPDDRGREHAKENDQAASLRSERSGCAHASVRPYRRDSRAPLVRPLRIYTLDPRCPIASAAWRRSSCLRELEKGPIGSLFAVSHEGAPSCSRRSRWIWTIPSPAVERTVANAVKRALPSPDGVCRLQPDVRGIPARAGRDIGWATAAPANGPLRLLVRPFGFAGRNAGYSREGGDLSFGYFNAGREPAGFTLQNGLICTALSHDIIAHETTHALLDGLRSSFLDPSNVDVPAFHEGFSDLVALFLHFTYADVVEQAIRESGGTITRGSLLTDIAREFGYAGPRPGRTAALRSGVDMEGFAAFDSDVLPTNEKGPIRYNAKLEPHALGSVLVSAVFEAFTTVVRRKSERLLRIAGLEPQSLGRIPISDALVKAIAQEASDVAGQFLNICIRAIDYCPPADMELGEYLRALITADGDMERSDKWGFREALMRSFRRRHIFPDHVQFMTEDAVRWQRPEKTLSVKGLAFSDLEFEGEPGQPASAEELVRQAHALGRFVTDPKYADCFQIVAPSARLPKGLSRPRRRSCSRSESRVARRRWPHPVRSWLK